MPDHSVISNTNKSILKITNANKLLNNYSFRATVEGISNDVSDEVEVKVYQPVSFDPIGDKEICKDAGINIEIKNLKGTSPYSFEWKENTRSWSNSDLNLSGVDALEGDYSVEISNKMCPPHEEKFRISHFDELTVNDISGSDQVCQNNAEKLTVLVSKDEALVDSYRWFKDEDATVISSTDSYTIAGLDKSEGGLYKVEVSDGCITKVKTKMIHIYDEIKATSTWDGTKKLCSGDEFIVEAMVSGDNPIFTWTVPNGRLVGNVSKLKIDEVTEADSGFINALLAEHVQEQEI